MALFRDRRVFPRWSFIDSRALPRPRRARDENSAQSVPTPVDTPDELETTPELEVWRDPEATAIRAATLPADAEGVEPGPDAVVGTGAASWLEERRRWFSESDWPTEASDEAVQLAGTHPDRPYTAPLHPGLPALTPAEVRARHGRGFASLTRRHRRRRHAHEPSRRRVDIDLAALEEALDAAVPAVGAGLVHAVVWHAGTGLALAARGDAAPEVASVWHGAAKEVRATLTHADLPSAGSYHLVGLADRRLAVLLIGHPDLGACLTVALDEVDVEELLGSTVPELGEALAATSREY